jgi:hypothetical protein
MFDNQLNGLTAQPTETIIGVSGDMVATHSAGASVRTAEGYGINA